MKKLSYKLFLYFFLLLVAAQLNTWRGKPLVLLKYPEVPIGYLSINGEEKGVNKKSMQ